MTMDRITAIKYSLRAFGCGLAGFFLPGLGVILAGYALLCWTRVLYRYRSDWNPASAYLSWGAVLASLTILLTILLALSIVVSMV